MEQIAAMFTERWYVLAFLATFIVVCWAERGWQRMLLWLASGTFIGWLTEFSSTHNGFPFGHYSYYKANFPHELFIGGVPIFASLSFAFLTYFAYSAASTFLSRLERRGSDIERVDDDAVNGSLRVLMLAALITTWVDTVIDPVSLLGRYWFLGDLYGYRVDGVHFGVPLSNYSGWLFTSVVIVALNQLFDALLRTWGVAVRGFHLPFKPTWALGTIFGNFAFMLAVTVYLMTSDGVPSTEPVGGILLSGLVLSGAFVAFAAVMIGRGLRRSELVLEPAR
jgi:uncharacterized membrane protein